MRGGGPAATAAVAAARMGATVDLWAIHGDDAAGAAARDDLERFGVGTASLRTVPGARTVVSAILVDPTGERWIFPYRGTGLADDPEAFPVAAAASYDAVHVDVRYPRVCGAAVAAARAAGVPTVADVGHARDLEHAADVDHLLVSAECAQEIADEPDEALAALRSRPEQLVGITLGPEGFLFDAPGLGMRHVPALPVDVVDSTGAGDVFHGAWAFGVASGWDAVRCALVASVAAAVSCTGEGRDAIPDLGTVSHMLEMQTAKEMDAARWV